MLKLVEHVQCADHAQMHVHELSGKVKVTLNVGCINNVYDYVGSVVNQLAADIKLFGRIGRQRICTRQVNNFQTVAKMVGVSILSIYSYTAVIAYPLIGTRGEVEKRGLAAIRIADKGNGYFDDRGRCGCERTISGRCVLSGRIICCT